MKRFYITTVALCSLFFSIACNADVYTWVDKDGKKHFGDHIPPEYVAKAKDVKTQTVNRMQAAVVTETAPTQRPSTQPNVIDNDNSQVSESELNCTERWHRFRRAERCFSECTLVTGGVNAAKCSHCTDVKKPDCEP